MVVTFVVVGALGAWYIVWRQKHTATEDTTFMHGKSVTLHRTRTPHEGGDMEADLIPTEDSMARLGESASTTERWGNIEASLANLEGFLGRSVDLQGETADIILVHVVADSASDGGDDGSDWRTDLRRAKMVARILNTSFHKPDKFPLDAQVTATLLRILGIYLGHRHRRIDNNAIRLLRSAIAHRLASREPFLRAVAADVVGYVTCKSGKRALDTLTRNLVQRIDEAQFNVRLHVVRALGVSAQMGVPDAQFRHPILLGLEAVLLADPHKECRKLAA